MCGWGGAKGFLKVGSGATLNLASGGTVIGIGDGTADISINGTVKMGKYGKVLSTATKSTHGINFTIGSSGRLECRQVSLARSTNPDFVLDGGTFAPNGEDANALSYVHLKVTDNDGVYEVPSGKTVNTGAWVSNASGSSKGRLVKTGAGTLNVNSWFRPGGGLRVNAGTAQITHNASLFPSLNYPLSISKTGTVTGGAFVMGSGGSLALEFASKTSGATMNITTSFTRNANIPITFSTESAFGFDDTYTLVQGGKIANTNNFSVASATANGVDITDGVYLAVESGNLVLKRKPYFYIKVAETGSLEIPKTWVDANVGEYAGETEAFISAMTSTGENGMKRWQSYCLGLEPNEAESVVLCEAAAEQPANGTVNITAGNLNVPGDLSGVEVTAYLDRKNGSGWDEDVARATVVSGTATLASPEIGDGISFFE